MTNSLQSDFVGFGFLRSDTLSVVHALRDWLKLEANKINQFPTYGSALQEMTPFTMPPTKILVMPTQSEWTCVLFNRKDRAGEPSYVQVLSDRLSSSGVYAAYISSQSDGQDDNDPFPACIFQGFNLVIDGNLCEIRNVYALNDGGRWTFGEFGDPLPFEDVLKYKNRRIKDRFTKELLAAYLSCLHIELFSTEFFSLLKPCYLIHIEP